MTIPKENIAELEKDMDDDLEKLESRKLVRVGNAFAENAETLNEKDFKDGKEYKGTQTALYMKAIECYGKALELDPEFKEAIDGKKRLEDYLQK